MSLPEMAALSVGLAMDAFAVAVAAGIALKRPRLSQALKVGLFFGAFQAGMPLAGWLVGGSLGELVRQADHWIAFGLLAFIGGRMIREGVRPAEGGIGANPLALAALLTLSLATSIDALAAGVGLAFIGSAIFVPAAMIGCVTFALSAAGVQLGSRVGHRIERWAHLAGGFILVGIGVRILLEHLG